MINGETIQSGMIIHCPKKEDAKELLKYLYDLGYRWINGASLFTVDDHYDNTQSNTCYIIEDDKRVAYGNVRFYEDYIEFSDLFNTKEEYANHTGEIKIIEKVGCQKNMDKDEIINMIVEQGMIDDILTELLELSLLEKKAITAHNRENNACLRAIYKIAKGTGDINAIMALSEGENA